MFIVTKHEGGEIKEGRKVATLRPTKAGGKGYFKIGSIQQVRDSRNFKDSPVCSVLVFGRVEKDLCQFSNREAPALGYSTIAEYLAQSYNQANPSTERVKYSFIEVFHFLDLCQAVGVDPTRFYIASLDVRL